jgi:tRNA pseudouridine38-40 synthase
MARYKIILAYDGTNFHGSQWQKGQRTVQGELETGLRKLGWTADRTLFAGRTDAGVHASGQVAVFDHPWDHGEETLRRALNAVLPADLRVMNLGTATEDFHPRYDAVQRRYRYTLEVSPVQDPLTRLYTWHVWPRPDLQRMEAASRMLIGIHNFAALGSAVSQDGSTIRQIDEANWQPDGNRMVFEIAGNAFLYHMVRHIVYVLVSIGLGKLEPGDLQRYLDEPETEPAQGLAPASGLNLVAVVYAPPASARIILTE